MTLEPVPDTWRWLDEIAGTLDNDFLEAAQEQPPSMERPELDQLFDS
jgi:antitoxin VapB